MPSLLQNCEELFATKDLYEILGTNKKASQNEVKKAYHKMSMKFHPDRVGDDEKEIATQKFQALGKTYTILSDEDKKAVYDETGEVDDENDIPQDRDWYDYWRLLFSKVSVKDIKDFERKYQGSNEELEDLKSAYLDSKGNIDDIIDSVLCATVEDESRFRKFLTKLIKAKELPDFDQFSKEKTKKQATRKRKAKEEAIEAEAAAKERGLNEHGSLQALILKNQQSRQGQFSGIIADLEAKYGQMDKKEKSAGSGKRKGKK